jgi:hypothetical protein
MCNQIVDEELIVFDGGDFLVLPFDTLHSGDKNREKVPSYKVFSIVFTEIALNKTLQQWIIDGARYYNEDETYTSTGSENSVSC